MGTGILDFLSIPSDDTKDGKMQGSMEYLGLDDASVRAIMEEQLDGKVAIAKLEYFVQVMPADRAPCTGEGRHTYHRR